MPKQSVQNQDVNDTYSVQTYSNYKYNFNDHLIDMLLNHYPNRKIKEYRQEDFHIKLNTKLSTNR